ncbi:MAG: hypothetical protein JW819_01990 [Candidatus Krumholzibacteriota bacterium]|nr:hypothetical protein [Candidatus Krumholzibacteriota bacterium]
MKRLRIAILALAILCLALPASAVTRTLTLDFCPVAGQCDTEWTEGNCALMAVTSVAGDCEPGNCYFAEFDNGVLYGLFLTCRLTIDLRNLEGIQSIEVDLQEGWATGCTRAFLYAGAAQIDADYSAGMGVDMLTLSAGGSLPTQLAVSGHECAVWEIRIIGEDLTPAAGESWTAVKSLY